MNTNYEKNTTTSSPAKAKTICKLGLDVHAASIMVARQVEGLNPQPPQKFKVANFLKWVKGQADKGFEVECTRVTDAYGIGRPPAAHWG